MRASPSVKLAHVKRIATWALWVLALSVSSIGAGSTTLLAMLSSAGIVGFGLLPSGAGQLAGRWGLRPALGVCPAAIAAMGALLLMVSQRLSAKPTADTAT